MPTSAQVVIEFVQGRPALEADLRKMADEGKFRAPEVQVELVQEALMEAFKEVSPEERVKLDRVRGNGRVDWEVVSKAFGG